MKKNLLLLKKLAFAIKEVYLSAPITFCCSVIISIVSGLGAYVAIDISRRILNCLQNIYLQNEKFERIIPLIILSAAVTLAISFLGWLGSVVTAKQKYKFSLYINQTFLKKNSELDIASFDTPEYFNILGEVEKSKNTLNFIVYRVIHFFSFIVSLAISFSVIFTYQDKYLGFIIILFILPALFNKGKYYTKLYKYDAATLPLQRKVSYCARILLNRETAKEIRFYNLKQYLLGKYNDNVNEQINGKKKIIYKYGIIDSICNVLPMMGVMMVMFIVARNIINGNGTIGDFSFYLGIFVTFKSNLLGMVEDISKLRESEYAIDKYKEFMALSPVIKDDGGLDIDSIEKIEFKNVSFIYPNSKEFVLNDVSFSMVCPEKIAIVGLNGSGKTTLIKLLLRFYDVTDGEILINGLNIKQYNLGKLRKLIAPAFQNNNIYSMSLRFNVALSDIEQSGDDEKITKKLKMFGLDRIADGEELDRDVTRDFSENGIMLSGGEKQKLTLARFSFADADVFIMDEPTAALDPISERKILNDFRIAYADKGVIIISHRLSNIVDMDKIIVLNNGKIVEDGTHQELYANRGLYYEMYMRQSSKYSEC